MEMSRSANRRERKGSEWLCLINLRYRHVFTGICQERMNASHEELCSAFKPRMLQCFFWCNPFLWVLLKALLYQILQLSAAFSPFLASEGYCSLSKPKILQCSRLVGDCHFVKNDAEAPDVNLRAYPRSLNEKLKGSSLTSFCSGAM